MDDQPQRVGLLDSLFLLGETHSTMMHVAALLPFTPPPEAGPEYLPDLIDDIRSNAVVRAPWNRKLRHSRLVTSPLQSWVVDKHFDLDYHLRRSALPTPGDDRELAALVSRLHSHELDFDRPPWELHFIEGLAGGRFAIYVKIHHSLIDGYSGMQILQRSLATDPANRAHPMFFEVGPERSGSGPAGGLVHGLLSAVRGAGAAATSTVKLGRALWNTDVRQGGAYHDLIGSLRAPDTILNRRIGRNRRFAAQQYSLPLLKKLGAERNATVNDVALSIVGGGLRAFLTELGDLPDKPLVAFVPVNIRPDGDAGGGNAVGAILASLATDVADPVARLDAVAASTQMAKAQLKGMPQQTMLAYALSVLSPALAQIGLAVAGVRPRRLPIDFNVTVSNVPGPSETRYLRGSRLEAIFPLSIPIHGVALNVTLEGYDDTLCFGFIGDRDVVPELPRLAVHTEAALRELQEALGVDV